MGRRVNTTALTSKALAYVPRSALLLAVGHICILCFQRHPPRGMQLTMRSDINHFRFFGTGPSGFYDRRQCMPFSTEPISILGDLLSPVSPSSSRVRIGTNTTPGRKDWTRSSTDSNRRPYGFGCLSERRRYVATVRSEKVLHMWFQP